MKKLLDLVRVSGCAAKISPLDLERYLEGLNVPSSEEVLISIGDDAGVFKFKDAYIIQTVDFITPVLNNPYKWASVSTANAISDIYAMGGKPLTALSIMCFNNCDMTHEDFELIIRGSIDKLTEAGAYLIGGHTVDDKEPKFGLAITGFSEREPITQSGALPNQIIVLTKPIGIGILVKALKENRIKEEDIKNAIYYMTMLNDKASELMLEMEASACTDVTGFGLLGHLYKMCKASNVGAIVYAERIPLHEGVIDLAKEKLFPKGTYENYRFVEHILDTNLEDFRVYLLCDPVTSGGLLFTIDKEREKDLCEKAETFGVDVWIVGETTEKKTLEVV